MRRGEREAGELELPSNIRCAHQEVLLKILCKGFIAGCISLALIACGGGGGGTSSSGETPGGGTGTVSTPDPAKQLAVSYGTVDTAKLATLPNVALSSSRETTTLAATAVTTSPNDLVMVRSGSSPILLAFTFAGETGVTVDYASTAVALVLMQPSLLGATAATQESLVPLIKANVNFQSLVDLISARINKGGADPLNAYVYPDIAHYASLIVDALPQQGPLAAKLLGRRLFAQTANSGFIATLDAVDADSLILTNPTSVYYDVIVNNHARLLDAKDGVYNLNYLLFPLDTNVVADKTTSFSLVNDFFKPVETNAYEISMSCSFNMNPVNGAATWRNIVKGLALSFESLGVPLDYASAAKFENFSKRYSAAFASLDTKLRIMKQNEQSTYFQARKVKALSHIMTIVIENLPLPADGSFSNEDKLNVLKTMRSLNDLIADVSVVSGNPTEQEYQAAINLFADLSNASPSIHEMVRKIRDGRMKSTFVWNTIKANIETMTTDTYLVYLSKPVPTGDGVKSQLLRTYAVIRLLAAESSITGDVPIVGLFKEFANPANGVVDEHAKALFAILTQNAFAGTYKALTVGNKMVPFSYDVAGCFGDESASTSVLVSGGTAVSLSKPVVKDFRITDYTTGAIIYDLKNGLTAPVSLPKGAQFDVFADVSIPNTMPYVSTKMAMDPLSSSQIPVYQAELFYNSKFKAGKTVEDTIRVSRPVVTGGLQWDHYEYSFGSASASPFNISTFAADQYRFARSGIILTEDVANLSFVFRNAAGQSETIVVANNVNVPPVVALHATRSLSDPSKYDYSITATDDKDPSLKLSVVWDFGDGATKTGGFTATHQYAETKEYTATVTVTDSGGASTVVSAVANPTVSKTSFVDVVFLVDLTGSYDDDLSTFRTQANEIVLGISSLGNNVQIGLASFLDFPVSPYGSGGDYPYRLDQQLTYLPEFITPALDRLKIGSGADLPESDLEALYQLATTDIGWIGSSKKVVLLATDAPFNNSDTDPSYPGHGYAETLAALKSRGIVVYGLVPEGSVIDDVSKIADDTGGKVFTLGAGSAGIVDAIKGISTTKALGKRLVVPNAYVVGSRKKQGNANR